MIKALVKIHKKEAYKVEVDGVEFTLECDIELVRAGIESLRDDYDFAEFGYYHYKGRMPRSGHTEDEKLSLEEYLDNIIKFRGEFEKRLKQDYAKKIIKKAKKKTDGSFYKNRVYDEYILRSVEDNGVGMYSAYSIRYKTSDDYVIQLTPKYGTK